MKSWIVATFGLVLVAAQDPAESRREEARKAVADALEKSAAKGGMVLTGFADPKPPEAEGMTFQMGDPDAGPQVEGKFTARVAADGAGVVVFENELLRYEIFMRGAKRAQRVAWSGKGAPVTGDIGYDLHRLLQWGAIAKEAAKAKGAESKADAEVDGTPCKVILCSIPAEYLDPPPKKKHEHAPTLEVTAVDATFSIGKADGLVKRVDFAVTRKMNLVFGGGDEDILLNTHYRIAVGSFDAALKVEIPADVEKQLK
jgi:hypothetical protein